MKIYDGFWRLKLHADCVVRVGSKRKGDKADGYALSNWMGVGPSFEMGQSGLGAEFVAALWGKGWEAIKNSVLEGLRSEMC